MQSVLSRLLFSSWTPAAVLALGLVSALVLQHAFGWLPCPLCIIQRLSAIALFAALMGFGATRPGSWARRVSVAVAALAMLAGLAGAGAHLWLLFGPQTQSCGPGIALFVAQLVDALPGSEWLLEGAGFCEDARYQVLGVPLPAWSGALHVVAFGLMAWQLRGRRTSN